MSRTTRTPAPALGEMLAQAMELFRYGRLAEAEALFRKVLQAQPVQFDALLMLGVVKAQRGDRAEAVRLIRKAIEKNPGVAFAHLSLGDVLHDMRQPAAALASYERALAIEPDNADALNNRATALRDLGRRDEALASYDRALAIAPGFFELCANRGNLLAELGRDAEALGSYDRALAIAPAHTAAWFGRGNVLARLGRHEEAIVAYSPHGSGKAGISRTPVVAATRNVRCVGMRRRSTVLPKRSRAGRIMPTPTIQLRPGARRVRSRHRRRRQLRSRHRAAAYKASRRRIIIAGWRCGCCGGSKRRSPVSMRPWRTTPGMPRPRRCGWIPPGICAIGKNSPPTATRWRTRAIRARPGAAAVAALHSFDDPELHLQAARAWIAKHAIADAARPGPYRHDRIRIAYVSADFRVHPVGNHVAPLVELHDHQPVRGDGHRARRPLTTARVRRRLEAAFDRFFSVAARTDADIAALMREQEIDIAVDLMGHTLDARPMIFAHRAAPVQVNWLGYPGTSGAGFFDFLLVDHAIFRTGDAAFYSEQVVCLPDTYQMNEAVTGGEAPTRAELGLPEQGAVLCCFNQPYKITPDVFAIWMRLLRGIEGSVLWLYASDAAARRNLRAAALNQGVAAERLVFADTVDRDRHLARVGQADLFLDTFPYGAHITASDALRAGVPVVTWSGRSFPTRVCESLLHSVGSAELVTRSLADYERLAMELAGDRAVLGAARQKILANLPGSGLFDARRFCGNIEAAYLRMVQD